jgi:hypothetical protein
VLPFRAAEVSAVDEVALDDSAGAVDPQDGGLEVVAGRRSGAVGRTADRVVAVNLDGVAVVDAVGGEGVGAAGEGHVAGDHVAGGGGGAADRVVSGARGLDDRIGLGERVESR